MPSSASDFRLGAVLLAFIATCVAVSALLPAPAAAEPEPGQAVWLYDPGKVVVVDLTLSADAIGRLEADPEEYVKGGFALHATDGIPGGEEIPFGPSLTEVGIRLKGNPGGSFRPLTGKAGFKVKFKEFDGPKFEGLKKLTLNSMVQDPSMIRETLAYATFRAFGVPAPRTGYAAVRVNGVDYGIYVNVEDFDDVGLERWFGELEDPQHLYEGEYGTDLRDGEAQDFEVDEGDEGEISDLEGLIAAVDTPGGEGWSERVAPVAELVEMTRMWAVEKYIGHWDGYAGGRSTLLSPRKGLPNNYFLFSDIAGRFQMLPWGTDQTWRTPVPFGGDGGLMFERCLEDAACEAIYREALVELREAVPSVDLDGLAVATAGLLRPWQLEEVGPRREHGEAQIEQGVSQTRAFIAARPRGLDRWLAPRDGELAPRNEGAPAGAPAPAPRQHSDAIASPPLARIGRSTVSDGFLGTTLHLAEAGKGSHVATISSPRGPLKVCAGRFEAPAPGVVTLRCRLSPLARKRLRARWLKLDVVIRLQSPDGEALTVKRRLHVPRSEGG